ncbi:HepT-like ribonuclease domain-containing protein [Pontibacter sp. MBLB2868]|uniref:HepT-like ribonuclease domain-containing protein n=1 Tax=Pontibacter sp. MBLB2868 TaxID=3451555 RepID=UPI003F753E55
MTDQEKKYLSDILAAIDKIELFVADTPTFEAYTLDLKTQSAVERQLSIIGEAVNHIDKLNAEPVLENARQIVGFRNRLIHAYDSMDNAIVWAILKRHIVPLKATAARLLVS